MVARSEHRQRPGQVRANPRQFEAPRPLRRGAGDAPARCEVRSRWTATSPDEMTGVLYPNAKAVVNRIDRRVDRELDRSGILRDSIFHRVFNQRLQKHRRNAAFERFGLNPFRDRQPIFEAEQLELEIIHHKIHFGSKWNGGIGVRRQGIAQDRSETSNGVPCLGRILVNQRTQTVQRVEQKMGVDLGTQGVQPRT